MVIGVTGGVGSGKSTVARMFGRRGARGLDADRITHELMRPGTAVTRRIRARFGGEVLAPQGGVDRRRLGRLVFGDRRRLKRLTGIIHPAVRREIQERLGRIRRIDVNEYIGRVTVSAGVAEYLAADTLELFLERADRAMYRSKQLGRDRVSVDSALMPVAANG